MTEHGHERKGERKLCSGVCWGDAVNDSSPEWKGWGAAGVGIGRELRHMWTSGWRCKFVVISVWCISQAG